MSSQNAENNTVTRYRYPFPSDYANFITKFAEARGKDGTEAIRQVNILMQVLLMPSQDESEFFLRSGEFEYPIKTSDGKLQLPDDDELRAIAGIGLEDIIRPEVDAAELKSQFKDPIETEDEQLKQEVIELVQVGADLIVDRFSEHLDSEHIYKLQHMHNGVVVVKDLKTLSVVEFEMLDLPDYMRIISPFIRFIFEPSGAVSDSHNALLLDGKYFNSWEISPEAKMHTVVHELMHTIGGNALPVLLDETATDDLAEEATGMSVHSASRMSFGYSNVSEILQWVKGQLSEDALLRLYLNPPFIKETMDTSSGKVISKDYVSSEYDTLRERLGKDKAGDEVWDKVLENIERKRTAQALNLVAAQTAKQRLSRSARYFWSALTR